MIILFPIVFVVVVFVFARGLDEKKSILCNNVSCIM